MPTPERESTPDLRPMSVADVFDAAFDLYKDNGSLFAGIYAFIHVPVTFINVLTVPLQQAAAQSAERGSSSEFPTEVFAYLGVLFLMMIIQVLFYIFGSGALSIAVSHRYLGSPIAIGQAFKAVASCLPKLFGTWFVLGLLLTVLMIVGAFMMLIVAGAIAMSSGRGGSPEGQFVAGLIGVVGIIGIMIASLVVLVWLGMFVTQIATIERAGYIEAIQRNLELIRNNVFRLLGATFLIGFIMSGVMFGCVFAIYGLLELFVYPSFHVSPVVQSMILQSLSGVAGLFVQPYGIICLTLLYFDQRVRREGFDLELLARRIQPVMPSVTQPIREAW